MGWLRKPQMVIIMRFGCGDEDFSLIEQFDQVDVIV